MIIDKQNLFSDAQDLSAAAVGSTASENVIDLGADSALVQDFVEKGGKFFAQIVTEVDSAGDGTTLQIQVQADDDVAFGTAVVLYETAAIEQSSMVAGYKFRLPALPPHTSKRYLRLNYVVGTEDFTAGAIDAGIVLDEQSNGM